MLIFIPVCIVTHMSELQTIIFMNIKVMLICNYIKTAHPHQNYGHNQHTTIVKIYYFQKLLQINKNISRVRKIKSFIISSEKCILDFSSKFIKKHCLGLIVVFLGFGLSLLTFYDTMRIPCHFTHNLADHLAKIQAVGNIQLNELIYKQVKYNSLARTHLMLKIAKQYLLFMGLVRKTKLHSFCSSNQKDDENRRKSMRVQAKLMKHIKQHQTLSKLVNFHLQKGINDPDSARSVSSEVLRLKNSPKMWNDSESTYMKRETINLLIEKIQKYVKQSQQLQTKQLINFLKIVYAQPSNTKLVDKIYRILQLRINTFDQQTWEHLMRTLDQRRYLTEGEHEMLDRFSLKIMKQIDTIGLMNLIRYYKTIKHQNMRIWGLSDLVKAMQKKVFRDFIKLNSKEIFVMLDYRNYFNRFSEYIFQDVIDSIDLNGMSPRDDHVFTFKALSLLVDGSNQFYLTKQQQQKVLNLLENNLEKKETITFLMNKNLLSHSNLLKLAGMIQNSFFKEIYSTFIPYTLTLLENDLLVQINDQHIVEVFEIEREFRTFTKDFISIGLIINLALKKFPKNMIYEKIQSQIRIHIEKYGLKYLQSRQNKQKTRDTIFTKFIRIYRKQFQALTDKQIKKSKQVPQFIFSFLIKINNMIRLDQLMKSYRDSMAINIGYLIEQLHNSPLKFFDCYKPIFELLVLQLTKLPCPADLRQKIQILLCNWEVHVQLTYDEADVFMQAAFALVKNYETNKSFSSYILNSPCKHIKQNISYFLFLEHLQNNQAVSTYDEAGVNYDLLIELIKLNLVKPQFAEKMYNYNTEVQGVVKQYLVMICKDGKTNLNAFEYNKDSFILLVKNTQIDSEYLTKFMDQILKLIPDCNIEDILLNFQLQLNKASIAILQKLVQEYLKQLKDKFERSLKLFYILSKSQLPIRVDIRDKLMEIGDQVDGDSKGKINFFSQLKQRCNFKPK